MKITTPKVIRWAGLSALAAGIIFAGIQPIHPPDVLSSVNTSAWAIITSFKTAMSLFALLGIAGIYARQVEKTGWLGLAGYLLFSLDCFEEFPRMLASPFSHQVVQGVPDDLVGLASVKQSSSFAQQQESGPV